MATEALIFFAVENLGKLLIDKAVFLHGVKGQVEWLKDELQTMQCFLRDAAEKQGNDRRICKWISDIREVALDAEDAIEMFTVKVKNERSSRVATGRCACFPFHLHHLHRVGKEIESIKQRLREISERRQRYGIQNLGEGTSTVLSRRSEDVERLRRLDPWKKDDRPVGLEKDTNILLRQVILNGERNGLSLAAIVGMGGSGKSTLARNLYNHDRVVNRFECRAWVVVSSEFAPQETIKKVMLQIQNTVEKRTEVARAVNKLEESMKDKLTLLQMLQEMLHTQLEGKTYFIVLDDVWDSRHWKSLESAFPNQQDKTSKLLLTSRNQIITKHEGYVHEMRLLDGDESWKLLLKTAKIDGQCPTELESIGREILKKCHGLPLAISIAGGLLGNKGELTSEQSKWDKVLRQMQNYHSETSEIGKNVSAILELSYDNLPPSLKACFLCLGFFEEDATIRAKRLVQIWVAQGFFGFEEVGGEGNMKEERARSYLDELVNRNLVQLKYRSMDNQVFNCQVHDLIRDLSIRKAEEEIGFEILREDGSSSKSLCKARHRAVYCSGQKFVLSSSKQNNHLRSLFLHVDGDNDVYLDSPSWKSFELLKILNIEGVLLVRFPDTFRALIRLKYLRIRKVIVLNLPSWLDRLENLEVMDLGDAEVEVPDINLKMDKLRHFYADDIRGPMRIETWKNLEALKYIFQDNLIRDDNSTTMASCHVRKLGILITDWSSAGDLHKSLEKMKNLVQLHFRWHKFYIPGVLKISLLDRLTKLKLDGQMDEFPDEFPPNLSHLSLSRCELRSGIDPMPVLGKLTKLVSLKFRYGIHSARVRVLRDGFPSLKVLSFNSMFSVSFIDLEEGGMPQLQRFDIYHCSGLKVENLPERLRSVATPIAG